MNIFGVFTFSFIKNDIFHHDRRYRKEKPYNYTYMQLHSSQHDFNFPLVSPPQSYLLYLDSMFETHLHSTQQSVLQDKVHMNNKCDNCGIFRPYILLNIHKGHIVIQLNQKSCNDKKDSVYAILLRGHLQTMWIDQEGGGGW